MPGISPRTLDKMSIGELLSAMSFVLKGRAEKVLYDSRTLDGPGEEPAGDDLDNDEDFEEEEDEDEEPDNEGTAS
jgi:hypothetical protein